MPQFFASGKGPFLFVYVQKDHTKSAQVLSFLLFSTV